MKTKALAIAALGIASLAISSPSLAHQNQNRAGISSQLYLGNGPISIGVDLGQVLFSGHHHDGYRNNYRTYDQHHRHSHSHGPECYRSYARNHGHWGGHYSAPAPQYRPSHRPQGHGWREPARQPRHNNHHADNHYNAAPRHQNQRPHKQGFAKPNGHQHSRDCHLHFPRGNAHWN